MPWILWMHMTIRALRYPIPPFKKKFAIDYKGPDYLFNLQDVIAECINDKKPENDRCKNWDRDRKIWLQRYLDNEPAKDIAEKYGIKSTNVDTIKSRFEARVAKHL